MSGLKPITIVGGGLAGLTLGIGLRQRNIPVTIWEAGHYPRHRVCGEFISGRGQSVLGRLGLLEELTRAGATMARTAGFFLGTAKSPVRPMGSPALCISRFILDHLLAEHFRSHGGNLREHARWEGDSRGEAIVRTSGRNVQPTENGWRWFGMKVHAREVQLGADLEMHGLPNGYVGLCRLPGEEVNVCGLFRAQPGRPDSATPAQALLRGAPGTVLHARLAAAVFEEASFCAVAGLSLRPQRAADHQDCRLGDALTMIPPVTGNGMSMAFEAAELALEPLTAYARGQSSWDEVRVVVAQKCDEAFRRRLAWAKWLQWMMFTPTLQGKLGALAVGSKPLWSLMFARTR